MVSYVPGPSVMVLLGVTSLKSGSPKSGTPRRPHYCCVSTRWTTFLTRGLNSQPAWNILHIHGHKIRSAMVG